mgnify:FL=1
MTKLYGSCATGFALNTSDVDIAISGFGFMDRMDVVIFLQSVQEKLSKFAWIKSITPIFSAAIPVLKLVLYLFLFFACIKANLLGH